MIRYIDAVVEDSGVLVVCCYAADGSCKHRFSFETVGAAQRCLTAIYDAVVQQSSLPVPP